MSHYTVKSSHKNKAFAKAVNALVVSGVSPVIAMNVTRWQWSLKNSPVAKKAWYGLPVEKTQGPSVVLGLKVEKGTQTGLPFEPVAESVKWQHVVQTKAGLLYDRRTQGEFALDCHL